MMIPRRRRTVRKSVVFGGIALVVLIVGIGVHAQVPHSVSSFFTRLAYPVWEVGASVASRASVFDVFQSKQTLSRENEKLRNELRDAQLLLADRAVILRENRELKAFQESASSTQGTIVAVLARPALTPYDTLVVDAGTHDGLEKGASVFVGEHIVLGTIEEVFPHTARVRLFSSPDVETDVFLPESDTVTVARGIGNGVFTLRIPSAISVAFHDPVQFSGGRLRILGFVDSVDVSSGDLFQTVWLRTPVNINTLQWVMIGE